MGDISKLREKIGKVPQVKFRELISLMIEHDLRDAEREKKLREST